MIGQQIFARFRLLKIKWFPFKGFVTSSKEKSSERTTEKNLLDYNYTVTERKRKFNFLLDPSLTSP